MVRWSDIAAVSSRMRGSKSRPRALSDLCNLAARLYSYPSVEWLGSFLTPGCLTDCICLFDDALIASMDAREGAEMLRSRVSASAGAALPERFGGSGEADAERQRAVISGIIQGFRTSFTRLHVAPPRPVSLQASWWMRRHGADGMPVNAGKAMNPDEAARVARQYRALGLRIRDEVNTPADHIANELDFLAYVLRMEADALHDGDEQSAREWNCVSLGFAREHFSTPAQLMAQETLARTEEPLHVFSARLLAALASASLRGTYASDGGYDDW